MTSRRPVLATSYAQGLLMGCADVIPGVSGGTVALIVGIYEPLVGSVRDAALAAVRLLRGDVPGARAAAGAVRWRLVLPLGLGILTALVVGAAVIPGLLERYPAQTSALFFGLIGGSLGVPWRRASRITPRSYALAAGCALLAFVLVGLPPRTVEDPALPAVFAAAAAAICAMILPGISGAFLLLVLGVYEVTLQALRGLDVAYIAVFGLGAAVGLGLFSRLLAHLLDVHHDATMAALVGLMAGSLRALWPWQAADRGLRAPPADLVEVAGVLLLAGVGFAAVTLLVRLGARSIRRADLTPDRAAHSA